MRRLLLSVMVLTAAACAKKTPAPDGTPVEAARPSQPARFDEVPRADFNFLAAEAGLPLFWTQDTDGDQKLSPGELAVYWGVSPEVRREKYVEGGAFTPAFEEAYAAIVERQAWKPTPPGSQPHSQHDRRNAVVAELRQGRPTLLLTDLSTASPAEKRLVGNMVKIASIIEELYQRQTGTFGFDAKIEEGDTASRTLFFRNQGFKCTAPKTQKDPDCSAIPFPPKEKLSGLYPAGPLQETGFCESMQAHPDKTLMDPFTVVKAKGEKTFEAVPYTREWPQQMGQVSALLKDAAKAFPAGEEQALVKYLEAAAQAFLDNNWVPADEAWAAMNATNSKWYLRVGPDETYAEPCSTKALFHLSFAKIDQGSLKWQALLDPLKKDLETEIATLSGKPYQARAVTFDLPDFIQIVLNAGDSRAPSGATIGQSLPNFGPVANEGRGRTVAMTNVGTDPDSRMVQEATGRSLFCQSALPRFTTDPEPQLMSTVLHEAAHNLGPSHQYKVNGKIDREAFGGPLASMLEELKAQTAALYYADWLAAKGHLTAEQAERAHVRDVLWAFGHISRGMYDEEQNPRAYSQLSAVQLGMLLKAGAVTWKPEELAANGADRGCFAFDLAKWPATTRAMMAEVGGIKARGDRAKAEKLVKDFVDDTGELKKLHGIITERVLRAPKATYVYAIEGL